MFAILILVGVLLMLTITWRSLRHPRRDRYHELSRRIATGELERRRLEADVVGHRVFTRQVLDAARRDVTRAVRETEQKRRGR
jgi:hypothetical protein